MRVEFVTFFCGFILFLSTSIYSQQEENDLDENCLKPPKKVMKLIDKSKKINEYSKRVEVIGEAIKMSPENAFLYFFYAEEIKKEGLRLIKTEFTPDRGLRMLKTAKQAFVKVLKCCPTYSGHVITEIVTLSLQNKEVDIAIDWMKKYTESNNNFIEPDIEFDKTKSVYEKYIQQFEEEKAFYSNKVSFESKIVENVSSGSDEYFPMISPDNELMFYTRKSDKRTLGDIKGSIVEEFTFSSRKAIGFDFSSGEALNFPFNDGSFTSYGAATVSVDNKEMIICACKQDELEGKSYLNCDLYSTIYSRSGQGGNDFSWSPLVNLGKTINTSDGWEGQPCLSSDGKLLFFATTRADSQDNDIYMSERDENDNWKQAVPFIEANSPGKDKSPFFHQDGETFYFVSSCSKERKGFGGLDIFYMRRENGKWSKPKNMGSPINTEGDEIGLFVSVDGKQAYYSGRKQSDWNIFSFELYEEARPKEVIIIKGELNDESGKPITDAEIEINYIGSGEVEKIRVNGNDGKYAAVVKVDPTRKQDVLITVSKDGHSFDSHLVEKEKLNPKDVSVKVEPLKIEKLKEGSNYEIQNLLFEPGSFELNKKSQIILEGFARYLINNPMIQIEIQGHTDDLGDDKVNLLLSESRCKSVQTLLISKGVEISRLTVKGMGESKPKFPNSSDLNRAKNRRTEFKIKQL
jgi:outer membrane protein OmpA-like peptidoglycan-associated protein